MRNVAVFSLVGQLIYEAEAVDDELVVDFSHFDKGVYLVRVTTDQGASTQRVCVL